MDDVATKPGKTAATAADDTPKTASGGEINRQPQETDGFQLVIDALKLNGIDTIFGLPGIPITDLTRQLAGARALRVISFRHEQNAGYAASIAGFMTHKPGICLTVSAPGFLNGLTALANATTNCFPMILISGSSEREIVDLQQGDYEEMDQLAIAKPHRQGGVPRPARRGHRRRRRAGDPGRGVRPSRRRLSRPARQAVPADDRRGEREEVTDQGRRSGAAPDPGARCRATRARSRSGAPSVR